MKRRIISFLLAILIVCCLLNTSAFAAGRETEARYMRISLTDVESNTLFLDDEFDFWVELLDRSKKVMPDESLDLNNLLNNCGYYMTVSNSKVARVSEDSLSLQLLSPGSVTVTVGFTELKLKARLKLKVLCPVESITVSGPSSVGVTKRITLKAAVAPANCSFKRVTWTSSDESIATVNSKGQVKGIRDGICTVTAVSNDGRNVLGTYEIIVTPTLKKLAVSASEPRDMTVGGVNQLTAVAFDTFGEQMEDAVIEWRSSSERVATVDQSGLVTAVSSGKAKITAVCSGKKTVLSFTVSEPEIPETAEVPEA